jgi:hypothetical protein
VPDTGRLLAAAEPEAVPLAAALVVFDDELFDDEHAAISRVAARNVAPNTFVELFTRGVPLAMWMWMPVRTSDVYAHCVLGPSCRRTGLSLTDARSKPNVRRHGV